jgi:FtsZ-binding cell division protein ZapB
MKREFEALESDYNSMKDKLEALKSRNAVIGNENKTFKEQVRTLLEKGKHDDELIEALMVNI